MQSKALQELVKKVFGDEKTKSEFISNPNSVMSRFSLTEEERKAVLVTHARLGLVTAGSTQLDTTVGPMVVWH
jgi:hypothetical protein